MQYMLNVPSFSKGWAEVVCVNCRTHSKIEAIYFGYLCPQSTIKTIRNIFAERKMKEPKFYKMNLNPRDVYKLQIERYY